MEALRLVLNQKALADPVSYQSIALQCILNPDLVDTHLNESSMQVVMERYILALFSFALSGRDWQQDYSFLSTRHVCGWRIPDPLQGVVCDGKYVTGIQLRK